MWLRDEATGEIVLRDDAGTEHARYEGAGAVFSDFAPLLKVGTDRSAGRSPRAAPQRLVVILKRETPVVLLIRLVLGWIE